MITIPDEFLLSQVSHIQGALQRAILETTTSDVADSNVRDAVGDLLKSASVCLDQIPRLLRDRPPFQMGQRVRYGVRGKIITWGFKTGTVRSCKRTNLASEWTVEVDWDQLDARETLGTLVPAHILEQVPADDVIQASLTAQDRAEAKEAMDRD